MNGAVEESQVTRVIQVTADELSVRFAVLGPVRAWRGDDEMELGSPQQRALLVALLLRRGRPAALDELIDAVWGEQPPATAVSVLRTYASRLRKVLEPGRDPAGARQLLVSVGDGYLARVADDALDVAVFEQQLGEARKLRADGDHERAADLLHTALAAWQGTPLAGLPGPLAESERARLEEQRLAALEARLDSDLHLGRHAEAVPELMSLTGRHPLREELHRLLMLALYRSSRQAEALAAYRTARQTLIAELGTDPGPVLQDLHRRILEGDATLSLPEDRPRDNSGRPQEDSERRQQAEPTDAAHPKPNVPAQLPADLPTFTGRSSELDRVRALLPDADRAPSTVVISAIGGMAGIGKTTLAVHWAHEIAHRFPDGQLFVNLRGFDPTGAAATPDEAVRVLLDALGVPPMRIPTGLDAQTALYRSLLAHRRVLILLDNARDADQVRPLLPGSPGSLVIVTSRNQLAGLVVGEGAHPLTLDPMPFEEAYDLLARRLGTGRLAAEPKAVEEIIARCAWLPLALAIVAAQAAAHPDFPLGAIADELRDSHGSLDAFASGDDITTDVRAVFSWSYQALSAPAARLFRLLGLASGTDLSATAAAGLAGLSPRETRPLLVELTRAHLLTEHFPGRYALHDLLRVYAAERAEAEEAAEERDSAVVRLLSWYLHSADAAYIHLVPRRRRVPLEALPDGVRPREFESHDQALAWCEAERANLVAAIQQAAAAGHSGIAWRQSSVLWGFFYLRSHTTEWLEAGRTALAVARAAGDREGEAWANSDVATALRTIGQYDDAITHQFQAMAGFRDLGDRPGRMTAIGNIGDAYLHTGDFKKSVEYTRRALAGDRHLGNAWGEGIALSNLGEAYLGLGRLEEATACLAEALVVLRASDNRWVEGVALDVLGSVDLKSGRYEEAVAHYRMALEIHREITNRWGEGHTLGHLGDAQLASGDRESARATWEQALCILAEFDHPDAEKIRERLARLETDG